MNNSTKIRLIGIVVGVVIGFLLVTLGIIKLLIIVVFGIVGYFLSFADWSPVGERIREIFGRRDEWEKEIDD
ncbi:MAG: hypothetical protein NTX05_04675 [Fusobacteria bacterium]|nr:hypothetical protein [Fusobacteriota bacterium]